MCEKNFDLNSGFTILVPLSPMLSPLRMTAKHDTDFNLPILHSLSRLNAWCSFLLTKYCPNSHIVALDNEQLIVNTRKTDTLNFLRSNGRVNFVIHLNELKTCAGTLLTDCRFLFDQF